MNIPKKALVAIFKSIEVHKGMDLIVKKRDDISKIFDYLQELEIEGYIYINSKYFTDDVKLRYSHLSFTAKGEELYRSLLNDMQAGIA